MFEALIVQPIFNLLVFIYALLPGHNFGLAIIVFTIVVRLLLWPLVRKQLHNARAMRELQPEIKRIKAKAKGDKMLERQLMLELYKEREVNPFSSLGVALVQLPIMIGLYIGLTKVVKDPKQIIDFSYSFLNGFPWLERLQQNIKLFDETLLGVVDLSRSAIGPEGVYVPALLIVFGAVIAQYYQTKQIMPTSKDARTLRAILKEAGSGKQADQEEVSAAMNRSMMLFMPVLILIFTLNIASGLSLYIFVGALVALVQQSYILRQDVTEIESKPKAAKRHDPNAAAEAEIIQTSSSTSTTKTKTKKGKSRNKKRRR